MIKVRDERDQINVAKVYRANQGHIFRFWDDLDRPQRKHLLGQIEQIDFQLIEKLVAQLLGGSQGNPTLIQSFAPPVVIPRRPSSEVQRARFEHARAVGEEALRDGRAAVFTVAGGQATRLGFAGPKGDYPIGPISGKPIFQILAEKIISTNKRYRVSIPWYILVSSHNRQATESSFQENQYYGLSKAEVFFITQKELPAVSLRGKILLADRDRIAMSPNGHGGSIESLYDSGSLAAMGRRGIDIVSYLQVDNPMARVVDPIFIGYHLLAGSEMSTKVVAREEADERVGVLASVDGALRVVEYTELSEALRGARDPDGLLVYRAGNTAMHLLDRPFLERLSDSGTKLPFHQAKKKVSWVDRKGVVQEPEEPNAIKFECFIFDALLHAANPIVLEVSREEEFAPLKSMEGDTSPEAVKAAMSRCYASWLEGAGVEVPRTEAGEVAARLEISPLTALDAEELKGRGDALELAIEPGQDVMI
jgi:UDP-N-acetylglucosamine/UDP-N-acetylgalactosamine diphosphorylase